jgi:hypothetical protein
MVHPVGWRLRAHAHGVSLSAFVSEAVSVLLRRGEPALGLWRPTLSQTIRDVKVLGSRARRLAAACGVALEMGGLEPPTPCLQSRCSPS